jgi:hypothetical protein
VSELLLGFPHVRGIRVFGAGLGSQIAKLELPNRRRLLFPVGVLESFYRALSRILEAVVQRRRRQRLTDLPGFFGPPIT